MLCTGMGTPPRTRSSSSLGGATFCILRGEEPKNHLAKEPDPSKRETTGLSRQEGFGRLDAQLGISSNRGAGSQIFASGNV